MKPVFQLAAEMLSSGRPVVLARIISQVGSAPRSTGTSCLVLDDGTLEGTIGGGRLEFQVIEESKGAMKDGRSRKLNFRLTGKDAAQTQMLCGGIVDVYLEPLHPSNGETKEIFQTTGRLSMEGKEAFLATVVRDGISWEEGGTHVLFDTNGTPLAGHIEGFSSPQAVWDLIRSARPLKMPKLLVPADRGDSLFVEPIIPQELLVIFGAGHISTFVAPLAKMVGFRVLVVDDREEFANRDRFPSADEVLCSPFSAAFQRTERWEDSFVVIVTRGHLSDLDVLREAIKLKCAYIGMIGSRRKRDIVFERLRQEGVSHRRLQEVHAPIGLHIGAETPEEIAISIVAELIMERARQRGTFNG